jgi:hypothetical protein
LLSTTSISKTASVSLISRILVPINRMKGSFLAGWVSPSSLVSWSPSASLFMEKSVVLSSSPTSPDNFWRGGRKVLLYQAMLATLWTKQASPGLSRLKKKN